MAQPLEHHSLWVGGTSKTFWKRFPGNILLYLAVVMVVSASEPNQTSVDFRQYIIKGSCIVVERKIQAGYRVLMLFFQSIHFSVDNSSNWTASLFRSLLLNGSANYAKFGTKLLHISSVLKWTSIQITFLKFLATYYISGMQGYFKISRSSNFSNMAYIVRKTRSIFMFPNLVANLTIERTMHAYKTCSSGSPGRRKMFGRWGRGNDSVLGKNSVLPFVKCTRGIA